MRLQVTATTPGYSHNAAKGVRNMTFRSAPDTAATRPDEPAPTRPSGRRTTAATAAATPTTAAATATTAPTTAATAATAVTAASTARPGVAVIPGRGATVTGSVMGSGMVTPRISTSRVETSGRPRGPALGRLDDRIDDPRHRSGTQHAERQQNEHGEQDIHSAKVSANPSGV